MHDWNRPKPSKVEPAAQIGQPPSDAIVLFDGTKESLDKNWQTGGWRRRSSSCCEAGYEVRLFGGSLRLYHCVDKEFRTMYVAAATLADSRVRSCVHDIEFDFVRRDGRHDVQDVINLELDRRTAADEMPHVTPDTVVKCPECGATFRVGKALV